MSSPACVEIYGDSISSNNITNMELEQSIIEQKTFMKELMGKGKNVEKEYTLDENINDLKNIENKYNEQSVFNQILIILKDKNQNITDIINENFKSNIQKIQTFANMIDSNNASSTIGTLEFIDQFSKLNTTSVLCKTDEMSYYTDV